MASKNNDLTIDQLLNDPVTIALMRADRVDPDALQAMLRGVAARLHHEGEAAKPAAATARSFPFFGNPAFKARKAFEGGAPFDRCRAP